MESFQVGLVERSTSKNIYCRIQQNYHRNNSENNLRKAYVGIGLKYILQQYCFASYRNVHWRIKLQTNRVNMGIRMASYTY